MKSPINTPIYIGTLFFIPTDYLIILPKNSPKAVIEIASGVVAF